MSVSVYSGTDRVIPRYALALIVAFDVAMVNRFHFFEPRPDPPVIWQPEFLLHIHDSPQLLIALSIIALLGTFAFAMRRRPILAGLVVLGCMALLTESYAAFIGGHRRMFFSAGAALTGWTLGLMAARALGGDRDRGDRLGEAGAAAALAATYVGSGVQKATHDAFFSTISLRAHLLSHHYVDDTSLIGNLAHQIAAEPVLAGLFSMSVLAIQLGSVLYIAGPRLRMLWGTLLISFHLGTLVFLELIYIEATVLLVVLSYPWERLLGRGLRGGDSAVEDPPMPAALASKISVAALGVVLLGAVLPTAGEAPSYAPGEHHSGRRGDAAPSEEEVDAGPPSVSAVGPIAVGDDLGGWTVAELLIAGNRVQVRLARAEDRVELQLSEPTPDGPIGAFDSGGLSIFYRATDISFAEFEPAGRALAARLVERAGKRGPAAIADWIDAASTD